MIVATATIAASSVVVSLASVDDAGPQDVVAVAGDPRTEGDARPTARAVSESSTPDGSLPTPAPEVAVHGIEGEVADGARAGVEVTGAVAGTVLRVQQCVRDGIGATSAWDGLSCDEARWRTARVGDDGAATVGLTLFHDVLAWGPESDATGWSACDPCALVVAAESRTRPLAVVDVAMVPTAMPVRPAIEVDGPLVPGGAVDVRVTGLQPGEATEVAWCVGETPQGGGVSPCEAGLASPPTGTVAVDGTFVAVDVPLPTADSSVAWTTCWENPGGCALGVVGEYGTPLVRLPVVGPG